MLRAVSRFYSEGQALEVLARRDAFKLFRSAVQPAQAARSSHDAAAGQTVLTTSPPPEAAAPPPPTHQRHTPPPPPPPPSRSWLSIAAAAAITSSIGGVYYYRKINDDVKEKVPAKSAVKNPSEEEEDGPIYPAKGSELPQRVEFLVVGGGTAAFAALRALRAARPDAALLLAGAERAPPYMRPPLSKELWRRADLAAAAADPLGLAFTQYNGKQRKLIYEPLSFYTPMERLAAGEAGAGLARGWRVSRLDAARRQAELSAPGRDPVTVAFDKCLIATGSVAKRLPALEPAAAAGRALTLHSVRDVARLARALQEPACRTVCVVGAGLLAAELAASLAERLREGGVTVVQVYREPAPLDELLPSYLAADAARRLQDVGVTLLPHSEIESCTVEDKRVHMRLRRTEGAGGAGGADTLTADVVVQCVGAEPAVELAEQAGLELHPELGGIVVNAELQARSGVWAAGDVACFHDVALGRRRVTHHDHAVLSGRRAAQNMAGEPDVYAHQSMFWSDLGPQRGYEAIGIIDSRLPTVGVFSADAVTDAGRELAAQAQAAGAAQAQAAGAAQAQAAGAAQAQAAGAAQAQAAGAAQAQAAGAAQAQAAGAAQAQAAGAAQAQAAGAAQAQAAGAAQAQAAGAAQAQAAGAAQAQAAGAAQAQAAGAAQAQAAGAAQAQAAGAAQAQAAGAAQAQAAGAAQAQAAGAAQAQAAGAAQAQAAGAAQAQAAGAAQAQAAGAAQAQAAGAAQAQAAGAAQAQAAGAAQAQAAGAEHKPQTSESHVGPHEKQYDRGVVFYLRERRVVGVLLWNLFNRMPVARQVLAQGEFDDLLEVAKLFAPQDD